MKRSILFTGALLALATVSTAAHAGPYANGSWVLAQWHGGQYWFPGVVSSSTNSTVTVEFDDGSRETRPTNQVKPYNWRVGSKVQCNWKGAGEWYPGTITWASNDGINLSIRYDDGDTEKTKTGKCRSL